MKYTPIIGLEVHIELATKSKMFCGCPADHFGRKPNTITCPVCLGLPGALPVPNKKAVEWTMLLGLALGCTVNEESKFDRKHYFYPDLPKGYQISQYDMPLCVDGSLVIARSESSNDAAISEAKEIPRKTRDVALLQIASPSERSRNDKKIRIRRVHLEEDTGKLLHEGDRTLVDFNRSGVPLAEIVTEPDFRSIEEVDVFVKKLQRIVRYLEISGADMEKGSMRIEPSVSLRAVAKQSLPTYRVELKNINSFRFVRKALEYEIERQQREEHVQQTRGWNEIKNATVAQREKEEAHDYRYFPEPDIPPMRWEKSQIANLKSQIGELPDAKKERFMKEYGLSEYDAALLVETKERAEFFEEVVAFGTPKPIANIIINKKATTKEEVISFLQSPSGMPEGELQTIIEQVLKNNQKAVEDYKNGKEQALGFLVGQVVRQIKGKGDAQGISVIIKRLIQRR